MYECITTSTYSTRVKHEWFIYLRLCTNAFTSVRLLGGGGGGGGGFIITYS